MLWVKAEVKMRGFRRCFRVCWHAEYWKKKSGWDVSGDQPFTAGRSRRKPTSVFKLVNPFPTPHSFHCKLIPFMQSFCHSLLIQVKNKKKDFSFKIQQKCQGLAPGRIKSARQWHGKHLREITLFLEG